MGVQCLKSLLLLILLRDSILCSRTQQSIELSPLPLSDLIRAVAIYESVDGLIASSDPHDHLIILSFDEYPLLPIGVDTLLLPHKEQA